MQKFLFYNPQISKVSEFYSIDFEDSGHKSTFLNGYFSSYKKFQITKRYLAVLDTNYIYYTIINITKNSTYDEHSVDWGYICIGDLSKFLFEISKLRAVYTEESIKVAMSELPFLYQYVRSWGRFEYKDICINLRNGSPIIQFYNKVYDNHSSDYSSEAKIAIEFINLCILEISSHKIDTSKFIKKERESQTPTWLMTAIKVGSKIAAKSLISNIDFDIDDNSNLNDSITIQLDPDISNIESLDLTSMATDCTDPQQSYNVSFQGSDTTPVFDTHKDVTIVSDTGVNYGSFDVYSKDNKEYIKFHSGSSADWSNWECIENGYFWHLGVKFSIKK